MSSTVVLTSLKVFHENIQCYIQYISYQDVTYDLFFYLSDSLLHLKKKKKKSQNEH